MSQFTALTEWAVKLFGVLAPVIAAFVAFANYRDHHGTSGKRREELETAKARLSIWETRVKIQEMTLVGDELAAARSEAKGAVLAVWEQANENLDILAERDRKPIPRKGLSKLRLLFLAYKPVHARSEYIHRFIYWSLLAVVCAHLGYGCFVLWRYAHFNLATKLEFRRLMLETKTGRQITTQFFALLVIPIFEAIWFWRLGRYERPVRKIQPLTQL